MRQSQSHSLAGARDNYDLLSRLNHWLIAFAMIAITIFGFYIANFAPRGPQLGQLFGIHKAVGVLILGFGVWRIGYRLLQGFKAEAVEMPSWQAKLSHVIHWVLIAAIVIMPLSGIIGSYFGGRAVEVFGLFTIPAGPEVKGLNNAAYALHGAMAWAFVIALGLHFAGALKHHLLDRDTTLLRMLGRA
ncbi:MAG: cytochrome b [Mangrovicoccus sp.]|nr:cytochrome b [Mangrovicoccus sp.]